MNVLKSLLKFQLKQKLYIRVRNLLMSIITTIMTIFFYGAMYVIAPLNIYIQIKFLYLNFNFHAQTEIINKH